MASKKQIDANRRNARKSTGPRTPEGKAVSRFNALKHGIDAESCIIRGEDPDELETLAREYHDEHRPQGPTQRHLVDRLVLCDWLRRRYHRIQAEMLEQFAREKEELAERCEEDCDYPIGAGFLSGCRGGNDAPVKLFRQINANDRTYDRALAALQRLQPGPSQPPTEPTSDPDPARPESPAPPELASFPNPSLNAAVTPAPGPQLVWRRPAPEPPKVLAFPNLPLSHDPVRRLSWV